MRSVDTSIGIRLRRTRSANSLLIVFAIVVSLMVGVLAAKSPAAAILLLVACAGTVVALSRPVLLLAAGVIFLAVEPARFVGADSIVGRPEVYKIILYVCILVFVFSRGLVWRRCAPLVAYALAAILTEFFGTRLAGLTAAQTADSLATLCLGWLVFAINWDWRRDHNLLKVLAWTPIVSVLLGLALQVVGVVSLFTGDSTPRLAGATIAAWLGTISFCAIMACLVLYRRERWTLARWVGVINVIILGGTLTRGAVLALSISIIPLMTRFIRRQLLVRGTSGVVKLVVVTAIFLGGVAVLLPGLRERDENSTSVVAGQSGEHDITSGRIRAWTFAYEQAKVNLAFGRGIGAGPIVGKSPGSPTGFTAQHNEYVRMLLEGGIIGGLIVLLSIVATMFSFIRRSPSLIRADLAAAGVAFAIYSITENTLSAAPIAVAVLLFFGISGSRASSPRASPREA